MVRLHPRFPRPDALCPYMTPSDLVRARLPPIRTQASEAWIAGDSGNEIRPFWTWFVLLVNPHRACPCCACQARGVAQAKGDAAGCRADAARGIADRKSTRLNSSN